MVRVFAFLLVLFFAAGCERDWMHIIVKKRVFLDGYYVHVPAKRETDPTEYPPPAQYPVNYPVASVARTDSSSAVNVIPFVQTDTAAVAYVPPAVPDTMIADNFPVVQQSDIPVQAGGGIDYGGGGGYFPGNGFSQPQPDTIFGYAFIQPQDSIPVQIPSDTTVAPPPIPQQPRRKIGKENEVVFLLGSMAAQQQYGYPVKWNSFAAGSGVRCRIKPFENQMEIVVDAGYRFNQLSIGQKRAKFFPLTPQVHESERITLHTLSSALCIRKNFKAQEKKIYLKWMDAGVYGDWNFHSANVYVDRFDDPLSHHASATTKLTGLRYVSKWNYGLTVRAGTNYANAFASWRLSSLVKNSAEARDHDLPRLVVGVEISIGQ